MSTEPQAAEAAQHPSEDGKITLTISTLDGDWTESFSVHEQLHALVQQTIAHLKLEGEGPWILEYDDEPLEQTQTIAQAGLKEDDILTLNPREAEGASRRQ